MEKDSARAVIQSRLKILAQFEKPGKRAEKWGKKSHGKQDDCRYEGEAISVE